MSTFYPAPRRAQLVVERLKNEILIYDLERDQANCLNETAALVWQAADGKTSVAEIANQLSQQLGTTIDERMVWYALAQLDKKHLLQNAAPLPPPAKRLTRRDFLVKAGIVGGAVVIPAVIALTAPSAAMAGLSCGQPCGDGGSGGCPRECPHCRNLPQGRVCTAV
ncbi:MAG: hypothetical protein HDKAJFGB_00771 [Anaerolineae bacterium]|nr:hypothetical protein [Anaerolineae bacterium]